MLDHRSVPELPEVEALAESLDRRLRGRRVSGLLVGSISALKTYEPPASALAGRTVGGVRRHGKFLDIAAPDGDPLGPLHLVVHLGRAGWLRWRDATSGARLAQRGPLAARLSFDDGIAIDVTEQGTEKRLALHVVRDPGQVPGIARLGVDALDQSLDPERLGELVRSRPGTLKSILADQAIVAGVGNAYSDEILHAARLSPFARSDRLDVDAVARLHASLRATLGEAVERARALDLDELKDAKRLAMRVHGRTGKPCPTCGDTVREVSFSSRSFQYCPTCQTSGRVYADRRLSRLLR